MTGDILQKGRDLTHKPCGRRRNGMERLSKIVRAEEGKCRLCGSTEDLRMCHIKSIRDFPELAFKRKNVVVLCLACDCRYGEDLEKVLKSQKEELTAGWG